MPTFDVEFYLVHTMYEMNERDVLSSFELMVMLAIMRVGQNAYGVPIAKELDAQRAHKVSRSMRDSP